MELKEFWIVTKPKKYSILADICYRTNSYGFVRQVEGGLSVMDDPKIFTDEGEAVLFAQELLGKR